MNKIQFKNVLPHVFQAVATEEHFASSIWLSDTTFERGHCYLIEADSGKGKSTFCSYILGYRHDYSGQVFFDNRDALWNSELQRFDLQAIQSFLDREGIALWDTAMAVRRLKDNASDKFLEIVEPIDLAGLLDAHPTISRVITTGEKATGVIAAQAGIEVPAIGVPVECRVGGHDFILWRMPSTSRAYPLALEKKAAAYRKVFEP